MKPIRYVVIAAGAFLAVMTVLSLLLFAKCRCTGKHFSPYICLIHHWTPAVRDELPSCRENLIVLEAVKFEWAREYGASDGVEVTWDDVRVYLPQAREPVCNHGGRYVLNPIGEEPECQGACCLHANPLEHALEPFTVYAASDGNPLASGRFTLEDWIAWRKSRLAPAARSHD
ncbi:MAG: hypothetical protein JW889_14400 [Verrucomicrobia bacterium]|nr:hypothetical protein [Verrucomicrobiota bacterium]